MTQTIVEPTDSERDKIRTFSVAVPVYQGERTLEALVDELGPLTRESVTPAGHRYQIIEVIMVHDGAKDNSDRVMKTLAARYPFVIPIWLSRNYGQHAATLAGIASSTGEWVVTLDEDGQQDPRDLGRFLDVAIEADAQLVYARPANPPPHGALRNALSRTTKWGFVKILGFKTMGEFNSFRLIDGEIARSLSAFCAHGVYLDVALAWVVNRSAHCMATLREERGRASGYNYSRLLSHFWSLVLTSGTQPLRLVAFGGLGSILMGMGLIAYAVFGKLTDRVPIPGWTSLFVVVSVFCGAILFSLGIVAEYLGVVVKMALGKPTYMTVSKPCRGRPNRS